MGLVLAISIAITNTREDQLQGKKGLLRVVTLEVSAHAGTWSTAVGSVLRQKREAQPLRKQSFLPHAGKKRKGGRVRARSTSGDLPPVRSQKGLLPPSHKTTDKGFNTWAFGRRDVKDPH